MLKTIALFVTFFYSLTTFAGECRVVNNTDQLSFDNIRIGHLKRHVVMGKSYAVLKKSINLSASCNNVKNFSFYYQAKNDGKAYSLDKGSGLYVFSIRNFILNGRERALKYHDSNQHAAQLLPGKEVTVENIHIGTQNISILLEVELFIDPEQYDNNISSSGEFVIHYY